MQRAANAKIITNTVIGMAEFINGLDEEEIEFLASHISISNFL